MVVQFTTHDKNAYYGSERPDDLGITVKHCNKIVVFFAEGSLLGLTSDMTLIPQPPSYIPPTLLFGYVKYPPEE